MEKIERTLKEIMTYFNPNALFNFTKDCLQIKLIELYLASMYYL